ncbi:MAG: MerR family transcriptional regulator [Faecalibacterium sp.]
MKINEVETAVGVTKKNIRFYEEEGLITPSREPGNGYRSYSQADVERLRKIKLLRKLDVPLAEIREMLEGSCTLAQGMARQRQRLEARQKDLSESIDFCKRLQQEPGCLKELDVEQALARLTAREEQGVTFVNIEHTDKKAERTRGACIGAALFIALMAFLIGIMAWAFYVDPQEAPPWPFLVVLFGIPVACILGTLKVLVERIEEIGKGEEDAYRDY